MQVLPVLQHVVLTRQPSTNPCAANQTGTVGAEIPHPSFWVYGAATQLLGLDQGYPLG